MSTIVFIENDTAIQTMLLNPLKEAGFNVEVVGNGDEGLQKIKEIKPELVLLDAEVPGKNGEEVLEGIRTDFDLAFIPVVVITGEQETGKNQKYVDLGACDAIQKSEMNAEVVLNKVQKCFNLAGGALTGSTPQNAVTAAAAQSQKMGTSPQDVRILIIEDDQFLSELCQTKLVKEGYETITALDGEIGLQKAIAEKPDIILLDILLPGIDGFEVLKQVKSHPDPEINRIPVLLLSNYGQESKIQRGMSLGAIDYLVKANFTTNEIVNKLKAILDGQGQKS